MNPKLKIRDAFETLFFSFFFLIQISGYFSVDNGMWKTEVINKTRNLIAVP